MALRCRAAIRDPRPGRFRLAHRDPAASASAWRLPDVDLPHRDRRGNRARHAARGTDLTVPPYARSETNLAGGPRSRPRCPGPAHGDARLLVLRNLCPVLGCAVLAGCP